MSSFSFNQLTEPTCYADPKAPSGFDPTIAYVLGQCCALSYEQYAKYPGKLATSGTFEAGETYQMIGEPFMTSESIGTGSTAGTSGDYRPVPIGFALKCTPASGSPYNVVTLRGTRTYSEWISDAEAFPAPFRVGTNNGDGYDDSVAFTATLPVEVLMKSAPPSMASSAARRIRSFSFSTPVSRIALTGTAKPAARFTRWTRVKTTSSRPSISDW